MDPDINPCENFYNFSCGNWIKKHYIPKDSTEVDVFDELREEVALQLRSKLFYATYIFICKCICRNIINNKC